MSNLEEFNQNFPFFFFFFSLPDSLSTEDLDIHWLEAPAPGDLLVTGLQRKEETFYAQITFLIH